MYKLWCKKKKIKIKILNIYKINNKNYKYIYFIINKKNVLKYFYLEKGIHKLIRKSNNKRQTSLAKVNIIKYKKKYNILINKKKILWQTIKSKGKGGQNVNKVSTAIRIKYKNINIKYNNFNSQYLNKKYILKILYNKILLNKYLNNKKKKKSIYKIYKNNKKIIRNYILYPYNLIKDYKSNYYTYNVKKFLNGNLNNLIKYKIYNLKI
ncbi:MAG: peptide chain release factor-like protein [Candidatus Shikimatogenerans sp. Tmey]